jgi:hypothetical protein
MSQKAVRIFCIGFVASFGIFIILMSMTKKSVGAELIQALIQ